MLSGIVFVNGYGLRWCDAPKDYGPHKTLYNRWKPWSERGVFLRMIPKWSFLSCNRGRLTSYPSRAAFQTHEARSTLVGPIPTPYFATAMLQAKTARCYEKSAITGAPLLSTFVVVGLKRPKNWLGGSDAFLPTEVNYDPAHEVSFVV